MNKLPLIEKIHLLESRLGERWSHSTFEPLKFDSSDTLKVHEVAKKIGQHLGLPTLTFFITFVNQKKNTGGNIELDQSTDVFIEIDVKFKNDCEFVLAILAHEICHKYLYLNNLKLFPEYENEMLTDAATIYTGLGKLSLNGCEKTNVTKETIGQTTTTSTSTQKIGYMNRQQFAFVYRLVCEMRRIPLEGMLQGLTAEATNEIKYISSNCSDYYNLNFFNNDFALGEISYAMKNEIGNSQKSFANFDRSIKVIQNSVLTHANQFCKEFHSYTKKKTETLFLSASKSYSKDAHNYIKNLVAVEELKFLKTKIIEKENDIKKMKIVFSQFIIYVDRIKPNQNFDFLLQFECPCCNNKMRISENKLARVKCPKCNYSFIIDVGLEESINSESETKNIKKDLSFWMKIKYLFSKKPKVYNAVID